MTQPHHTDHKVNWKKQAAGIALLILALVSCKENLPSYHDPRNVFDVRLQGSYVLTISDNSLKVYIVVVNAYDETFEGPVVVGGTIEIVFLKDPLVKKTFALSASNLISGGNYNPSENTMRIDPGDTLRFRVSWNFVDDNGTDLRTGTFQYSTDPQCTQRLIAKEEVFSLLGEIKVFEKIPLAKGITVQYPMRHVLNYFSPSHCTPTVRPSTPIESHSPGVTTK